MQYVKFNMKTHVVMCIEREGKYLFVKRSMLKKDLKGAWAFPSGTREEGELIKETAERECREELGVTVISTEYMAGTNLSEFNVTLLFLNCKLFEGEEPSIKQPEEFTEIAWFTLDEFFNKFKDKEIGHGLRWLRNNREGFE